jgi:hypothetical protein
MKSKKFFALLWVGLAILITILSFRTTYSISILDEEIKKNKRDQLYYIKSQHWAEERIKTSMNSNETERDQERLREFKVELFKLDDEYLALEFEREEAQSFLSYLSGFGLFITTAAIALAYDMNTEGVTTKIFKKKVVTQKELKDLSLGIGTSSRLYIPKNRKKLKRDLEKEIKRSNIKP